MRLRLAPRPSLLHRGAGALTGERAALVRCAAGVLLLARPRTLEQVLGAAPQPAGRTDWLVRMFAARELALGLGVLEAAASTDRRRARPWFLAGAMSDAVDAVVLTRAVRDGDLGRTGWTRAVAVVCTAGAVGAAGVQVVAAAGSGRR